jgi:hypothetical protein
MTAALGATSVIRMTDTLMITLQKAATTTT